MNRLEDIIEKAKAIQKQIPGAWDVWDQESSPSLVQEMAEALLEAKAALQWLAKNSTHNLPANDPYRTALHRIEKLERGE